MNAMEYSLELIKDYEDIAWSLLEDLPRDEVEQLIPHLGRKAVIATDPQHFLALEALRYFNALRTVLAMKRTRPEVPAMAALIAMRYLKDATNFRATDALIDQMDVFKHHARARENWVSANKAYLDERHGPTRELYKKAVDIARTVWEQGNTMKHNQMAKYIAFECEVNGKYIFNNVSLPRLMEALKKELRRMKRTDLIFGHPDSR